MESVSKTREDGCGIEVEIISESASKRMDARGEGELILESESKTREDGCGIEVEMISESASKTREDG